MPASTALIVRQEELPNRAMPADHSLPIFIRLLRGPTRKLGTFYPKEAARSAEEKLGLAGQQRQAVDDDMDSGAPI